MKRPKKTHSDEYWMGLAINEAIKAKGHTSPNPMVGAILVKNDKMIAVGFHRRAGLPHAEIEALRKTKNLSGSTLYVTLEPCCHSNKRTPPCTDAIVRSGIKRVVVGTLDPNPHVSGRGMKFLQKAKIRTHLGILKEECANLNLFYNHWIATRKPWVVLKAATSVDGKVALSSGQSRWISNPASRLWVHQLRSEVDAILVGIGTVQADDPQLTSRWKQGVHQPIRIVLDPQFKISERAKVLAKKNSTPCWIISSPAQMKSPKKQRLEKMGNVVLSCPVIGKNKFDLKKLLKILGEKEIISLLVEGGSEIWTSFIQQKCAQELLIFMAPKLLGADAKPFMAPLGHKKLASSEMLIPEYFEVIEGDILLGYRFR